MAASMSVAWNDPTIGIDWQVPASDVILSEKDRLNKCIAAADYLFDYNEELY